MIQSQNQAKCIKTGFRLSCIFLLAFLLSPVIYGLMPFPSAQAVDAMGLRDCSKPEISQGLRGANAAASANANMAGKDAFDASVRAHANEWPPSHPGGLIKDAYCLDNISMYFDIIRSMLDGASFIETMLSAAINGLLDALCAAATSAIQATVENALNSICISLPSLPSFSIDLPDVSRKSCDGVSLATVMSVGVMPAQSITSPLPSDFMSAPMSRWIDGNNFGPSSSTINMPRF